jgi:hypothetical protein
MPELFVKGFDSQVYAHKFDANGNPTGAYFPTFAGQVGAIGAANDPIVDGTTLVPPGVSAVAPVDNGERSAAVAPALTAAPAVAPARILPTTTVMAPSAATPATTAVSVALPLIVRVPRMDFYAWSLAPHIALAIPSDPINGRLDVALAGPPLAGVYGVGNDRSFSAGLLDAFFTQSVGDREPDQLNRETDMMIAPAVVDDFFAGEVVPQGRQARYHLVRPAENARRR